MNNLYNAGFSIGKLERLAMGDSAVHRLHPAVKVLTTLLYMITVISFKETGLSGMAVYFFYPFVMVALADIPPGPLFSRLALALPFSLIGALANLFLQKEAVYIMGGFQVTLGMLSFASIMTKTFLTVFAALILISTTTFSDISRQLYTAKVPQILCLQLTMTYRYISTLINEAGSMYRAYKLRAPGLKGIKMKDMGSFLGQLILRSFDYAEAVYNAMKLRGFTGAYKGQSNKKMKANDIVFLASSVFLIIFFRFFRMF